MEVRVCVDAWSYLVTGDMIPMLISKSFNATLVFSSEHLSCSNANRLANSTRGLALSINASISVKA
jgi:hypothetical protein